MHTGALPSVNGTLCKASANAPTIPPSFLPSSPPSLVISRNTSHAKAGGGCWKWCAVGAGACGVSWAGGWEGLLRGSIKASASSAQAW